MEKWVILVDIILVHKSLVTLSQNHAQHLCTIQGHERSFTSQFGLTVQIRCHSTNDIYFIYFKEMHN